MEARTARRWLARLGFHWTEVRKGVYIDGHELRFLEQLKGLEPYLFEFNEEGGIKPKEYPRGCQVGGLHPPVILVTHDESTLNSNEARSRAWKEVHSTFLRPKGHGRGIMISDFLLPCGRLTAESLSIEQRQYFNIPEHASKLFEFSSQNSSGYWSTEDIISHTLDTGIKMFEAVYPGYKALFLFDNASSHSSFAEDALRVQNMNLSGGGEQATMRNGYFLLKGTRTIQSMVYENGIPKGIEAVLQERGLWAAGLRLECPKLQCEDCRARKRCKKILSLQYDFLNQKGKLQEMIEATGHTVLFYPKFHCELNWIEYYWGQVKRYTHDNCEYNYEGLKTIIPQALSSVKPTTISLFYARTQRIMEAYHNGLTYGSTGYHEYLSHRRVRHLEDDF
ncbi:hypothetical protein L873DRAFT_1837574 [Choiromyces venosus 120613-1]|uniref:Tc1-like transposase DDE domain-containing protein n=1 Tax=Choiromyces venosus 120613-1 TaxID=1336337 RepID=A0A3N4JBD0_9PEZI|nr:hypothetical protein L873DRAFT_1837574 [Choiromyces venosus 120613-1]